MARKELKQVIVKHHVTGWMIMLRFHDVKSLKIIFSLRIFFSIKILVKQEIAKQKWKF